MKCRFDPTSFCRSFAREALCQDMCYDKSFVIQILEGTVTPPDPILPAKNIVCSCLRSPAFAMSASISGAVLGGKIHDEHMQADPVCQDEVMRLRCRYRVIVVVVS